MKKGNIWKCLLPYFVAVISFFAISSLYFYPQFAGKQILMHDITQYKGSTQDIVETFEQTGEEPHWTGNMFGGMPAYLIGLKYDNALVVSKTLFKIGDLMGRPASLIFIAMLGFFVMLMLWGVNPWVGIVPSLAYGLSTYFLIIIGAGHITKMVALAYVPFMIGAVFYTYRKNMWLGAALTALFAMMELAAGHPQITYYFVMVLLAYWISELIHSIKNKILPHFAKATGLIALAVILAVGANFASLWYVTHHSSHTIRGGSELAASTKGNQAITSGKGLDIDYATAWSYGKAESFNMLIPNLMGGSSSGGFSEGGKTSQALTSYYAESLARQNSVPANNPEIVAMAKQYADKDTTRLPAYWGDQPLTAGPTYIGAVVIFLCIMGLFLPGGRTKWWILAISIIAIFLAWGRNMMWFTELFYNYFPGYNKFRTVAMILVIVEWTVPFMAALMLHKLCKGTVRREAVIKALKLSLYITGGIALFFALLGPSIFNFTAPGDTAHFTPDMISGMRAERMSMMRTDAWRSLAFVLMGGAVVGLFVYGKIKKGVMIAALAVLVVLDLYPVGRRYLSADVFVEPRHTEILPTEADLAIMDDVELGFRVINATVSPFNDATTSYFHRSVGGYSGAKLQRYQDMIDLYLGRGNQGVLDMLNTKYIISRDDQSGRYQADINPGANGAAWFVREVKYTDSPDGEILAIGSTDLKSTAIIDRTKFAEKAFAYDSMAAIELVEYSPARLAYHYTCSVETMAVFSEIYYKDGWSAMIDGVPTDHFRVNYILRGMILPAGEHKVEFSFISPGYKTVRGLTLACSSLIIALVIAAVVASILCRRRNSIEK